MNPLANLTLQQKLIGAGVLVVAVAALFARRKSSSAADTAEAPPADPPAGTLPGGDGTGDSAAIGTGTLAQWSETFTSALGDLSTRLGDLEARPTTTPSTGGTGNPLAPSSVPKSQLGHRQTTSRNVQPAGRGFAGETPGEIARRVYGDRGYWNFVRFFNAKVWPGSPDKAIRAGTVIYY